MGQIGEGVDYMKKKGLLVLATAAMLVVGTGTATWAASGWAMSDGNWVYYDSSGSLVTYDWKKGADDQWRYLNGSGTMAVNEWVDELYYVDGNGIMVSGKWMQLDSNYNGATDETRWYYFGTSGKVVTEAWKKINDKWYYFDDTGAMATGWADDNMYFCGDDGAAKVGWQKLEPPEEDEVETDAFDEDDGRRWYYFSSSGKKYIPSNDADYGERRIDNAYYCFDSTGIMQTGWVYLGDESAENARMSDYRFYGSDGKVRTGWYSAEPPEDRGGYEEEVEWFYFSKSGIPRAAADDSHLNATDILTIGKKRYLFNENGTPVYGLQRVYNSSSSDDYTAYYFGTKQNCVANSGRMTVEEGDGSSCEYYFTESGKGFTGVKNNSLYYRGKLQKAEQGLKYEVISVPAGSSGHTNYLVNTSGKIVKATSSSGVKDADGTRYTTNSSGVLQKINGESVSSSDTFADVREPIWY